MTAQLHNIDPKVYARRWTTLGVLSLGLLIIGLDNTILNVALPSLQDQLGAEGSALQWIVDSYLLVFAGLRTHLWGLRRSVRAEARPPSRDRDLRSRESVRGGRRLGGPADRRPRRDGRRGGADHARHALDHLERLPA